MLFWYWGQPILAQSADVTIQQTSIPPDHATVAPNRLTTPSPTAATNTLLTTETPAASQTSSPIPTMADFATPTVQLRPNHLHGVNRTRDYTVQPGDTVLSVALEVGMNLEDIYCAVASDFTLDQPLVIGDALEIPTPDIVCHEVQVGETLMQMAAQYSLTPDEMEPFTSLHRFFEAHVDDCVSPTHSNL